MLQGSCLEFDSDLACKATPVESASLEMYRQLLAEFCVCTAGAPTSVATLQVTNRQLQPHKAQNQQEYSIGTLVFCPRTQRYSSMYSRPAAEVAIFRNFPMACNGYVQG